MTHFTNLQYCYFFKDSYYFKKNINPKYLKNKNKQFIFRRSLKLILNKKMYKFFSINEEELKKFLIHINLELTNFLKKGEKLDVHDINFYIQDITESYIQRAIIENSKLEENRLKQLQNIDENGVLENGYELQKLSERFKYLDLLYKKLVIKTKEVREEGLKIIKNSDVSFEEVLAKIPPEKMQHLYEMAIKSEREVIKNDIKMYIKRNLEQFYILISPNSKNFDEKLDEAFNRYINLIMENKEQKSYIQLIKNQKPINNISFDKNSIKEIIEELAKEKSEEAILNQKSDINILVNNFCNYINYKGSTLKNAKAELTPLSDYLKGNGKEYLAKSCEDLTNEDVRELEILISEATPKNRAKKYDNATLFDLVEFRKKDPSLKPYSNNTILGMEAQIKKFWKYYVKQIDKTQDPLLFDDFNPSFIRSNKNIEEDLIEECSRGFTNKEIEILINEKLNENEIKRLLINNPKNFYALIIGILTGMRGAEIALIETESVKKHIGRDKQEYYYFYVSKSDLKTEAAHRNVPIHQLLIDLGFLNYVKRRIEHKKENLFDFSEASRNSNLTNYLKRFIEKSLILNENEKLNFHSFRRRIATKLTHFAEAGEENDKNIDKLLGHTIAGSRKSYLGRLDPQIGYKVLDNLIKEDDLDFLPLINRTQEYFSKYNIEIVYNLDLDTSFDYSTISTQKREKTRKI
ncbi:hypothetical protein N5T90_10965 [Aliarcobacter cryaerophilus]|uniref:hypothetical protein n=1 Tax=Aliarcobacter cryaerophilus TaxID=28198 RepID=UPI0021B68437|nr:hypothetical protein [Aliarcobacter cryaerophilus]MCT7471398.1 hypothetical protein [Aliarcobacter cryaerophilus]